MGKLITIDEVARQFSLSKATVNYYTNLGLISYKQKNRNRRLYDQREVEERIKRIHTMLNEGYTLRLIQKQLLTKE